MSGALDPHAQGLILRLLRGTFRDHPASRLPENHRKAALRILYQLELFTTLIGFLYTEPKLSCVDAVICLLRSPALGRLPCRPMTTRGDQNFSPLRSFTMDS